MKRKIQITAVERVRIIGGNGQSFCPVCQNFAEFLTTMQAAEIASVRAESVRCWLIKGIAHGTKTVGGRHRVCRNSLFQNVHENSAAEKKDEKILFGNIFNRFLPNAR